MLYLRRNTRFRPLLRGGHQERGRRAGTENSAGIVGLGMACELAELHMPMLQGPIRELRDRLQEGLLALARRITCPTVVEAVEEASTGLRGPTSLVIDYQVRRLG